MKAYCTEREGERERETRKRERESAREDEAHEGVCGAGFPAWLAKNSSSSAIAASDDASL
jgi:hypothetical protein